MQRFTEKLVIVTGAASGIGQAAAIRLAAEGAYVICTDVDEKGLEATLASVEAAGGKAEAKPCDISDETAVNSLVDGCIKTHKKIDALVNMAGVLQFSNCHEMSLEAWQRIININLTGTFLLCRAVLPHLVESKGNIVNAASTAALAGLPWGGAYAASKGGVLSLTRSIAVEYGKRGVRANCVCPGDIQTNMFNQVVFPEDADLDLLGRIMSLTGAKGPEVVAGVIAMLASDDGAHITGEEIRVEGGMLA